MEIRYIRETDDSYAISRIYEEGWRFAYRGIIPQDYLDAIQEGRWAKDLDHPLGYRMVCVENGIFIGTASFCRSRSERWPDAGEVVSIYLLPEYVGKGYGKQLMEAVLEEVKKLGFREVFLWVLEENARARRFYEAAGFVCSDDRMTGRISGKDLTEIRYIYRFA